jgi:hypothetical protein
MGLVVHAMEGFDYERASAAVQLPPDCRPECMVAVGRPGPEEALPSKLREREGVPSLRRPISEFVVEGGFGQLAGGGATPAT